MTPERIEVAEGLLVWARKSVGMDQSVAAKRLGVSVATLTQWELGERNPTVKQLRKAASVYRRPLAVLLLPSPPDDFDALRDFRAPSGSSSSSGWSPELHAEYRRAVSQREVFLELAELAPGAVTPGKPTLHLERSESTELAGLHVRDWLGVQMEDRWSDSGKALNSWVRAVEDKGVMVLQTNRIAVREMRGFSISEWPFPVIALNGSDTVRARLFTLIHEVAHILVNAGGLCDLHEHRSKPRDEDQIELFCNRVAASALMPEAAIVNLPEVSDADEARDWTLEELARLSRPFGVSSEAFLLRLVSLERATWDLYQRRKPELEAQYEEAKRLQRLRRQERGGGPSYYVVKARNLGHAYVVSVLEAFHSRAISSLDVADYLDVRYEQIPKLAEAAG